MLGEVVAGAVLKHARDRDLTRESVLGSKLAPETPAYDLQQACGTGLETVITVANKIALGQIDAGIAGGVDTASDAPIAVNEDLRHILLDLNRAKSLPGRARHADAAAAGPDRARDPAATPSRAPGCRWASTRPGPRSSGASRGRSRTSSRSPRTCTWRRPTSAGSTTDLVTPYLGLERDENLRPDSTVEKLAKLKPVFGDTMTAGNSTPLTDGASAVLLASEEWAAARGLPVLAYFVDAQTAAVDHVHTGEGLLMAPAYALPRLLDRNGLALDDFDLYEIHEAFASQVLATLAAWRDPVFAREKLGRDGAVGEIDRVEAERQRRLAGRGASVRRDRRADRGVAGQGAGRARRRARRDLDLRRRRAGRRGDPGEGMSDRYSQLVRLPVAGTVAKRIGLPQPVDAGARRRVLRPRAARRRGPRGGRRGAGAGGRWAPTRRPRSTTPCARSSPPRRPRRRRLQPAGAGRPAFKALVFDATGAPSWSSCSASSIRPSGASSRPGA